MGPALLVLLILGAGYLLVRSGDLSSEPPHEPMQPVIKPGDRVWLLGDSLAVGLSTPMRKLAQASDVDIEATVKVGAPLRWGVQRAQERVSADDVWLVCLGANNGGSDGELVRDRVRAIRALAQQQGVHVVWLLPPDGGGMAWYKTVFPAIASEAKDFVLPPKETEFAPDGIHLTPTGYRQWAAHVWSSLTVSVEG